jgi:hypothetical protein
MSHAIETILPAAREMRRKFVLALAQNVEGQVIASPQVFQHHGAMVHAYQHQRRIERNRRKRAGRHAVRASLGVQHRYDCYAGWKLRAGAAKGGFIDALGRLLVGLA